MERFGEVENEARMLRGELYHAFLPGLTVKRNRCHHACHRFNQAGESPRRKQVELWREYVPIHAEHRPILELLSDLYISILDDKTPLPPQGATEEEDSLLLQDDAYVESPIKVDYGTNLRYDSLRRSLNTCLYFVESVKESS